MLCPGCTTLTSVGCGESSNCAKMVVRSGAGLRSCCVATNALSLWITVDGLEMARGALKGLKRNRPAPGEKVVVKGQLTQGNGGRSPAPTSNGGTSQHGEIKLSLLLIVQNPSGQLLHPVRTFVTDSLFLRQCFYNYIFIIALVFYR